MTDPDFAARQQAEERRRRQDEQWRAEQERQNEALRLSRGSDPLGLSSAPMQRHPLSTSPVRTQRHPLSTSPVQGMDIDIRQQRAMEAASSLAANLRRIESEPLLSGVPPRSLTTRMGRARITGPQGGNEPKRYRRSKDKPPYEYADCSLPMERPTGVHSDARRDEIGQIGTRIDQYYRDAELPCMDWDDGLRGQFHMIDSLESWNAVSEQFLEGFRATGVLAASLETRPYIPQAVQEQPHEYPNWFVSDQGLAGAAIANISFGTADGHVYVFDVAALREEMDQTCVP